MCCSELGAVPCAQHDVRCSSAVRMRSARRLHVDAIRQRLCEREADAIRQRLCDMKQGGKVMLHRGKRPLHCD